MSPQNPNSDAPSGVQPFQPPGRTEFLARAIRDGERGSFPELFERVMPALFAWIELRLRRTNVRTIEASDVLQDVWLHALQAVHSYDPERSFRAWILGIAKNVLLQHLQRRSAAPLPARKLEPGSSSMANDVTDSVTSIGTRLAKTDSMQKFLEFVDQLEPGERALLLYCGIEGYSSTQASTRLGISSEAVTKRWQVLRARLRQNTSIESLAAAILE